VGWLGGFFVLLWVGGGLDWCFIVVVGFCGEVGYFVFRVEGLGWDFCFMCYLGFEGGFCGGKYFVLGFFFMECLICDGLFGLGYVCFSGFGLGFGWCLLFVEVVVGGVWFCFLFIWFLDFFVLLVGFC